MAYSKTDFTQDSGAVYKAKIDENFAALEDAATKGLTTDDYAANGGTIVEFENDELTVPVEHWVRISEKTASNDSEIDFVLDTNTYGQFKVVARGLSFSDGADLLMRFSDDAGASFFNTDYNWSRLGIRNSPFDEDVETSADSISLAIVGGTSQWGEIVLRTPGVDSEERPRMASDLQGGRFRFLCSGDRGGATEVAINAIRFLPTEGTFTIGSLILYGWKDGS